MKKFSLFLCVSLFVVLAGGCIKETNSCQPKTVESEDAAMQAFATTFGGGGYTKHSSGMYYSIVNAGNTTKKPNLNSTLSVKYTGRYMDNTIFEQPPSAVNFPLNGVIAGWQIALPLVGEGGTIRMIIPSSYAYGCTGKGSIPPYTILYFEVELIAVL